MPRKAVPLVVVEALGNRASVPDGGVGRGIENRRSMGNDRRYSRQ